MSKKVYVGNLPFSITQDDLKTLFEDYGEITEAVVITNKFSGRSKGFGFVTLADDAMAEKAISELNGKDFQGRALTVNEAKPFDPNAPRKEFRPSRGFGGRREGGFNRRRNEDSDE